MIILNESMLGLNNINTATVYDNLDSELESLIAESSNEYNKILMDFTSKYFLSESVIILNEGFNEIIEKIIEFFKQLKDKIVALFTKFKAAIKDLRDKFLKSMDNVETKLKSSKFGSKYTIEYRGFKGLDLKDIENMLKELDSVTNVKITIAPPADVNSEDEIEDNLDKYENDSKKIAEYLANIGSCLNVMSDEPKKFKDLPTAILNKCKTVSDLLDKISPKLRDMSDSITDDIDKTVTSLLKFKSQAIKSTETGDFINKKKQYYVEASNILRNASNGLAAVNGKMSSLSISIRKYLIIILNAL